MVVKCATCSLVFLGNPPPEDTLYDDYYSTVEPTPDEYRADSPNALLRELFAINQQRVARIKGLQPTGSILDIGCGRGHFLQTAAEHGFRTYGVDVSEKAVAYGRERFGLKTEVRSMEELLASGQQFDVITLWHVLEHFADPYEALTNIAQLLKVGGMCVVEVPNLRSLKFMLSKTKWEGGNHPLYHRTFFTGTTLQDAFVKSQFSPVRRMRWSYTVPGRSIAYEGLKKALNIFALDAFLNVVGWNGEKV